MKLIVKDKKEFRRLIEKKYKKELDIQNLIYNNPDIIPIEEIEEDFKILKVTREFGIPGAGSTDLVGIDNNANIYIIECKLAYNPQIKREVIGQILEYSSFIWKMQFNEFEQRFIQREGRSILDIFSDEITDPENQQEFTDKIKYNLDKGVFRLLIVVDKLNDTLKRNLEYINNISSENVQIIGLEIVYFKDQNFEYFVPNIFGFKSKSIISNRKIWNEEMFLSEINSLTKEKKNILIYLLNFIKSNAPLYRWGTGVEVGSLTYRISYNDNDVTLFSIYTDGKISFSFAEIENKIGKDSLNDFLNMLKNNVRTFSEINKSIYFGKKYPQFDLTEYFSNLSGLEDFKKIIVDFQNSFSNVF